MRAKGSQPKEQRFCAQCGHKAQPPDIFCAGCGRRLGEPAAKNAPTHLLAGLLVLVFFLSAGFALWMQVLSSGRTQLPPPAAQAVAPMLPEGHPPLGLPPQAKQALARLENEALQAPTDVEKWRQLAGMQYQASRFEAEYYAKAEASFNKLIALEPENPEALLGLGNLHYDKRDYTKAAEYYEQYLERKGENPAVETDLATSYLYQGKVDKAIADYKKIVGKHPDFAKAHFNLGMAYRTAGRKDEAVRWLKRARDLSPDPKIKERIGSLVDQLLDEEPGPGARRKPPQQTDAS